MGKTLLIDDRRGGDWSLDLLFAGLVRRLGPENVVDYPYHVKHRELLAYDGNPEHDWGLERRTLGWTPNPPLIPQEPPDILKMLYRGEIERIFLDERLECYELYLRLGCHHFDVPVVVVAGHDRFNNSIGGLKAWYGKRLEAIFLDNWREEYSTEPLAHVFNWSINFDQYWPKKDRKQKKVYDISFMGYNSHPDRAAIIDHIEKKWGHLNNHIFLEREPGTMRGFIKKGDYFDIMAQSKICLNLRGAAENGKTLRFYEIPYVGSLMLTQYSGAVQVHPFRDAEHCLYFRDLEQLDRRIEMILDPTCEPELRSIAQRGHEHAMKFHTVEARTQQMYEVLDGQG